MIRRTRKCNSYFLGLALVFSSCGPIQAYPGPKLSSEETATLRPARAIQDELVSGSINGVEFKTRGVALLPGRYFLSIVIDSRQPGKCRSEVVTHLGSYALCLQRHPTNHSRCERENARETYTHCDFAVLPMRCGGEVNLIEGEGYEILAPERTARATTLSLYSPNHIPEPLRCLEGQPVERQKTSYQRGSGL